jgi:hypothetical protein
VIAEARLVDDVDVAVEPVGKKPLQERGELIGAGLVVRRRFDLDQRAQIGEHTPLVLPHDIEEAGQRFRRSGG